MATRLIAPHQTFTDSNGAPLSGGKLNFYTTGTTARKNTYTTESLSTANANPVVLNAAGRAAVAVWGSGEYKLVVEDANGVAQSPTYDPVLGSGLTGARVVSTIADMTVMAKSGLANSDQAVVGGYTALGDGGGGTFYWSSASTATVAAGTIIAADEGGTGRWLRIINTPAVDPRQFGAVADGSTDDAVALAAAAATGKAIDLGGKSYKTTVAITVTNSVYNGTLIPTSAITAANSVLKYTGSGGRFFGLTFTGGSTIVATAITVTATSSNFFIHDNNFSTFKNGGIAIQSGATGFFVTSNHLDACSAVSSGLQYGAINCNGSDGVLSLNTLTNCTQTGISSLGVSNNRYIGNKISGDGASIYSGGIISDGASRGLVIDGNSIYNVAVEAILIAGNITSYGAATFDVVITNNVLVECGTSGVTLQGGDAGSILNVTISGNVIRKAATTNSAIQTNRAYYVQVTGNWVGGYLTGVDSINSSKSVNVIGNTFVGQGGKGISAEALNSDISGNYIYGVLASSDGIFFDYTIATNVLISNNVVQNCLVGIRGKFASTASGYVKNNHLVGNATHTVYTTPQPNSSFGNTFGDVVLAGTGTLVAGTVSVTNSAVAAGERINFWRTAAGGSVGALYLTSISVGGGFVITSTNGADTSAIAWEIVR